jgi:hypothetical protein
LADVAERQNEFLQSLAIRELEGQKQRIETYQVQARYELAAIYDRTSNGPNNAPKPPPSAPAEPPPSAPAEPPPEAKP